MRSVRRPQHDALMLLRYFLRANQTSSVAHLTNREVESLRHHASSTSRFCQLASAVSWRPRRVGAQGRGPWGIGGVKSGGLWQTLNSPLTHEQVPRPRTHHIFNTSGKTTHHGLHGTRRSPRYMTRI
eukprot:1193743-Prorocentrum_minimum.AAC.2